MNTKQSDVIVTFVKHWWPTGQYQIPADKYLPLMIRFYTLCHIAGSGCDTVLISTEGGAFTTFRSWDMTQNKELNSKLCMVQAHYKRSSGPWRITILPPKEFAKTLTGDWDGLNVMHHHTPGLIHWLSREELGYENL